MIVDNDLPIEQLIIGCSLAVLTLRERIRKIGPSPLAVLIHGPSGAGKELVARALHNASRRAGRFVACNVPSFSEGLFEDAMFGHVRGAFTGAVNTTDGILREAHKGTVFLDEVAQLRLSGQVSLLRVLETRNVRAVGSSRDQQGDFRVIAATNENLPKLIQTGAFREDLLHRLAGVTVHVPPLCERRDDIPLLADHFVRRLPLHSASILFSNEAMTSLSRYSWPGNIRELKSVVESLVYLSDTGRISDQDVHAALEDRQSFGVAMPRQHRKRLELLSVLERYENNLDSVATYYKRTKATIYRWLQEHQIETPERVRSRYQISSNVDDSTRCEQTAE